MLPRAYLLYGLCALWCLSSVEAGNDALDGATENVGLISPCNEYRAVVAAEAIGTDSLSCDALMAAYHKQKEAFIRENGPRFQNLEDWSVLKRVWSLRGIQLAKLDISNEIIGQQVAFNFEALVEALKSINAVSVDVSRNDMKADRAAKIVGALATTRVLQKLNIGQNIIDERLTYKWQDVTPFAHAIRVSGLIELNLDGSNFNTEQVGIILNHLPASIQSFSMVYAYYDDDMLEPFEALGQYPLLNALSCGHRFLSVQNAASLLQTLASTNLEKVVISMGASSEEDSELAFSEAVANFSSLRRLAFAGAIVKRNNDCIRRITGLINQLYSTTNRYMRAVLSETAIDLFELDRSHDDAADIDSTGER